MGGRRKFEVFILDKPYTVLSDGQEMVSELAAYVDRQMREAIEMGHAVNPEKAAVLAALNIAEALFRSRREMERLRIDIETRSRAMLEAFEES